MADYDNNMKGVLFKNDKKNNDSAPWYKGSITIDDVEYELAAWLRESKKGNKFLSLKATTKQKQGRQDDSPPAPEPEGMSEIPF